MTAESAGAAASQYIMLLKQYDPAKLLSNEALMDISNKQEEETVDENTDDE